MYTNASNFVGDVDTAYAVIFGISFFFIFLITGVMIYFIIKYQHKKHPKAVQIKGSTSLEIIWTLIPLALVIIMFYFGWRGYRTMHSAPEDAMHITTTARMWNWSFEYENGKVTDTLYVPINLPVNLNLVSVDVIHSLSIPAFRLKQDMVPGKKQIMWFIPGQEGDFDLFCTEYCGLRHSYMTTKVVVMTEEKFNAWYNDTTAVKSGSGSETGGETAQGLNLLRTNGCLACHSLDGSKIVGPTFKDLYKHEVTVLSNGTEKTIVADDEYIHNSIYDPNMDVVKGFNQGLMQSYKDIIDKDGVNQIIEYLKTISKHQE